MTNFRFLEGPTTSLVDRGFWNYSSPSKPSVANYLYQIGLWDLEKSEIIEIDGADPVADVRGNPWYQFPVPPQSYEMTENPSTIVTPTQGGGKFIESQGVLFRDVRLSGTVGLRPHAGSNNLIPAGITAATGVSVSIPPTLTNLGLNVDEETGLPKDIKGKKEITGYDDIIFLRNLFRAYWDRKRSNVYARKTVMVWVSAKDSDIYIVEPMGFTTTRDKGNPFGWNYQINLRTLCRFDMTIQKYADPVDLFDTIMNGISTLKQAMKDIAKAMNQIISAVNFITSLPAQLSSTFLSLGMDIYNIGSSMGSAGTWFGRAGVSMENVCKQMQDQTTTINREAIINKAAETFNLTVQQELQFRLALLEGTPLPIPTNISDDQLAEFAKNVHRNDAINAIELARITAERLLSLKELYPETKQVVINDHKNVYNTNGAQFNAGSPLNLNNMNIPSSIEMDIVGANETIRSIAKRTMGNESYWKMIAIVNNLKSPYISATASDGVLAYNSKIMIPKRAEEGDTGSVSLESPENEESQQDTFQLRQFGRDLKLSTGSSGTDYSDLQVSAQGDLDLVEKESNMSQAIMIKFATEQGELPLHSEFGAMYPIGTKLFLPKLQEFILNTRKTLLQDSRISAVLNLNAYSVGDVLHLSARAQLRQSNITLPVEFSVRSA
jgi:hypothetical protein